jgi:malonyl-CoA O-methyltransferase
LSGNSPGIDALAARRRFDRAAKTYAAASRLEAEIGVRMLERLDYVKIAPRRILDAGSGPARETKPLLSRYPGAQVLAADFSLQMLQAGRRRFLFFDKNPSRALCADLARLPLADGSVNLVWCNMALHWTQDPVAVFGEFQRVLAAEGLLMFSTLGPDTLKELRTAAGAERVHRFTDMHDLGDMLVAAGFAAPVMDMELLTFTYDNAAALLADLRDSGQTSARVDRPRGLTGKGFGPHVRAALAPRATFEVLYGHAWKTSPRKRADGREVVQFHPPSLR